MQEMAQALVGIASKNRSNNMYAILTLQQLLNSINICRTLGVVLVIMNSEIAWFNSIVGHVTNLHPS